MKKNIAFVLALVYAVSTFSNVTTIVSSGFTFSPSSANISAGDSVLFQLASIHNAVEVSQATWNADGTTPLAGGFSLPHGGGLVLPAQLTPGIHYYVCQPHASMGMKGTITVAQGLTPTITFQKMYGLAGNTSDSWAANILQTADGGYATVGYISNFGAGADDESLLKLKTNGDTSWVRIFGTPTSDDAAQIIKTIDGGYALVGFTASANGGNAFLQKVDTGGNLSWAKIYGTGDSTSDSWFSSATQAPDGSYVMAGYISNYGAGSDDFYLLKADVSGNLLWTKTYGGAYADDAYSIATTNDGGYILAGKTNSFADTLGDVYIIKTNANGDTLWTRTYGSNLADATDRANSIQQTTDHGYIIAGFTQSASQGEYALLIKIDSTGTIQWTKLYGTGTSSSDASAAAVVQTTDGGYAFTGYISNFGAGSDDYYLVKTNGNGDTIFTRTFGSAGQDDASGIIQTSDGGYMISGWTNGFQYGGGHAYYVKADSNGHTSGCGSENNTGTAINSSITFYSRGTATQASSGGVGGNGSYNTTDGGAMLSPCAAAGIAEVGSPATQVSIFPNPFSDKATVEIATARDLHDGIFIMYDAMGKEVNRVNIQDRTEFNIYSGPLADGLYLYRILSDGLTVTKGKIIIVR